MARLELVIFDCDGVLIDSERLAVRIEREMLEALGWELTEREIADQFVGRSAAAMFEAIEAPSAGRWRPRGRTSSTTATARRSGRS